MLDAMRQACSTHSAKHCLGSLRAMHATNATDATNERRPSLGKTPYVSYPASPVDKWVLRVVAS